MLILKQYRPTIIVDYIRTAYRDEKLKASITIDKEIKSTKDCSKFFEEIETQKSQKYILEIKFEKYLPEYMKNIITNIENKKIAKSKFMTQLKKYN